jgi:hypothetical protein
MPAADPVPAGSHDRRRNVHPAAAIASRPAPSANGHSGIRPEGDWVDAAGPGVPALGTVTVNDHDPETT